MATLEELVVKLTADTSELKAELATATKITANAAKDMQKSIEDFANKSSQKTSFFQQTMATMTGFLGSQAVLGAFNAVKDAASFLIGELQEGAEAAMAQEKAMARLGNALNASGKYSQKAVSDLGAFADEMERLTGIGDDVVLSNLAVLSSITRLNSDGLQKAQKSALELSAAMGIDLDGATRLVGKAIEGNSSALKRYGIDIQTTSDKTQNLANVTKALNDKFGGAAAAQMNTFGGALLSLKNAWGNVSEAIANTVTSNEVFISVMKSIAAVFRDVEKYIAENATTLRDQLGGALVFVLTAVQNTMYGFSALFSFLNAGLQVVLIPIKNLIDQVQLLKAAATLDWDGVKENIADIGNNYKTAFEAVKNVGGDNAFDTIANKIGEIKDNAQMAFERMQAGGETAAVSIKKVTGSVTELTEAQKAHNEVIKSFGEGLASQSGALDANYKFQSELQQAQLEQAMAVAGDNYSMQLELQTEFFEAKNQLMFDQFAIEQAALDEARSKGLISETQYQDAVVALGQKQQVDTQKSIADRAKFEENVNKTRQANFKSTMDTIATLSSSGNKELAAIGKAAAITNATIDGYAAVQKALASAPPPFNFALAAVVGVATAANVAKIAGVGFNKGTDSVPGVGSRDSVPAFLTPGERVVPQKTNQDLTEFLQNQGQNSGQTINLNITMNVAPGTGITQEQASTIVEGINNYIAAGGLKLA